MPEQDSIEKIKTPESNSDNLLDVFKLSLEYSGAIIKEIEAMKAKAKTKEEKIGIDETMSERLKIAVESASKKFNDYYEAYKKTN